MSGAEVGVAIVTRGRRESLLRTLAELTALPEQPPVAVVDNGSRDGTAAAVASRFPQVQLVVSDRNLGAAGRNLAAIRLGTPLLAFSDDDSWWDPGALATASACFRGRPRLGLVAARILVGPERRLDPISRAMAGPPAPGLPGPRVDGFVACGAVVRREAFLAAGGFCERFLIGGEERLLAIDLREAGWDLCYAPTVTAVHIPGDHERRDRGWLVERNDLWTSWLRYPARQALRDTAALLRETPRRPGARRALAAAVRGLPWTLAARRPPDQTARNQTAQEKRQPRRTP